MGDKSVEEAHRLIKSQVNKVSDIGMSQEQSQQAYRKWATTYDQDYAATDFVGPQLTAEYLAKVVPEKDRATTSVIDIGAGTGLVSVELKKLGFKLIDGLDPCAEMLDKAKARNLYNKYFLDFVTEDPLDISENTYDCLTGSGIYAEANHVKREACKEMIRLVKPGGYIVLVTRKALVEECATYRGKLEPYMDKLEKEGKWKRIIRDTGVMFYADWEAIVLVYKDLAISGFKGPQLAAEYLAKVVPEKDRATISVIDIGAGTGLVSVELKKLGFKKIDGLDPSAEMLDLAKERNLYDKYLLEYVTADPLDIPENTYDCLTGSGIFAEGGHVKPEACNEMIRLVKPGGYIVLSTRKALVEECVTYSGKLEPYMDKLEKEGKWKRIVRDTGVKFYAD